MIVIVAGVHVAVVSLALPRQYHYYTVYTLLLFPFPSERLGRKLGFRQMKSVGNRFPDVSENEVARMRSCHITSVISGRMNLFHYSVCLAREHS